MNSLPAYQIIFLLIIPFSIGWYLFTKNWQKRNLPVDEVKHRNFILTIFFISYFYFLLIIKGENVILHVTSAIIYTLLGISLISKRRVALYILPASIILRVIISSSIYGFLKIDLQTVLFSAVDLYYLYLIYKNYRKLLK